MRHPFRLAVWDCDPLPLGALAYHPHSASYWRAVSKAALQERER